MRPLEEEVDRSLLAAAIKTLSPREEEIIRLRFGLGGGREQTQKEVAAIEAAADRLLKAVNERSYNDAMLDEIAHLIKENAAKLIQE